MTKNNDLKELMEALETIRAEKHPDVPKELLELLLAAEYENQDKRGEGQTKSMNLLEDYLNKLID
ncbi:MAG: DNA modification system-associated small protein [bacterium]|jgi:cytochrome P450